MQGADNKPTLIKPVIVSKLYLDPIHTKVIASIFNFQREFNSAQPLNSFLPELNTTQLQVLQGLRSHYKVACAEIPAQNMDGDDLMVSFNCRFDKQQILEWMSDGHKNLLLIAKKANEDGFLYFGFINLHLESLSPEILYVSLKASEEVDLRSKPFEPERLREYLKMKLSNPQTSSVPVGDLSPPSMCSFSQTTTSQKTSLFRTPALMSPAMRLSLRKKLSRDRRRERQMQESLDALPLGEEGSKIQEFLIKHGHKIQVPEAINVLVNRIPLPQQKYFLQGMLKNIHKISSFSTHCTRMMSELVFNSTQSTTQLFNKDSPAEKDILNQPCASGIPLPMNNDHNQFKFSDEAEIEQNPYLPSNLSYHHPSDPNHQSQYYKPLAERDNLCFTLALNNKPRDKYVQEMMVKIRRELSEAGLKIRNLEDMATKFVESKRSGALRLDMTPEDLVKMKLSVGKGYCEVLHALYMKQLKNQIRNYNANAFQNTLRDTIESIKKKMEEEDFEMPSIHQIKRFNLSLSLEEFCDIINKKSEISNCFKVQVPLNEDTRIETVIKFTKKNYCVYIEVEDLQHSYDAKIALSKFDQIHPKKLIHYILKNKSGVREEERQGDVRQQCSSVEDVCQLIEDVVLNGEKDYLTTFYAEISGNRKLMIMIKVLRFDSLDNILTLKFKIRVIVDCSRYDVDYAWSMRMGRKGRRSDEEEEEEEEEVEEND